MSNLNKTFVCASCQTSIVLTSEGDSFICPKCQVNNVIPKKNNPLMNLIVYVISFFVLYYAYSWWINRETDREMNRINKQMDQEMDKYNKEMEKYNNY